MKYLIVGLGSMGKRRIRLLQKFKEQENGANELEICGVDSRSDRRLEAERLFGIRTEASLEKALQSVSANAAFICTSPLSHADIITKCLQKNLHVFTEINLVSDGYEGNMELADRMNRILYLSSTPMHRREMHFIKNWVKENNYKVTYRYHVGQYLPEWHPWENYRDFFVNDKRTNGCRELFAIELPWMSDAFGRITQYSSQHCRLSELNVSYDDTYQVMFQHSTGMKGCLMIDVVTPMAGRKIEIFGEGIYLSWGGTPDTLMVLNRDKQLEQVSLYNDASHEDGYEKFIIEDAYYEEIKEFINCITQGCDKTYSFDQDREILEIIDRIEE